MPVFASGDVLSSSSTDSILSRSLDKLLKPTNGSSLDANVSCDSIQYNNTSRLCFINTDFSSFSSWNQLIIPRCWTALWNLKSVNRSTILLNQIFVSAINPCTMATMIRKTPFNSNPTNRITGRKVTFSMTSSTRYHGEECNLASNALQRILFESNWWKKCIAAGIAKIRPVVFEDSFFISLIIFDWHPLVILMDFAIRHLNAKHP